MLSHAECRVMYAITLSLQRHHACIEVMQGSQ